MRLWSVVVIQLVQPRGSRRTSRATTCGTAGRVVVEAISVAAISGGSGVGPWVLVELRPASRGGRVGRLELALLGGQIALELGGRDGPDVGDHVGVVAAAELRALPAEDRALHAVRDLEPRVVRVARHGVELAAQPRDPPGVDDVLGL